MIEDNFEEAVKRSHDCRSDSNSGDRDIENKQDDAEIRSRSGSNSGPNTSSDDGVAEDFEEDEND